MTQYNTLNVNFSDSQLNKLKPGIIYGTEVTLKLSSNVVGDSNDENNFPHKLLLTNTRVSSIPKAFGNGLSANIKLENKTIKRFFRETFRTISKSWIAFNRKCT